MGSHIGQHTANRPIGDTSNFSVQTIASISKGRTLAEKFALLNRFKVMTHFVMMNFVMMNFVMPSLDDEYFNDELCYGEFCNDKLCNDKLCNDELW